MNTDRDSASGGSLRRPPEPDEVCSICLDDIKDGEEVDEPFECVTMPHKYHKQCVNRWIARTGDSAKCPQCRAGLKEDRRQPREHYRFQTNEAAFQAVLEELRLKDTDGDLTYSDKLERILAETDRDIIDFSDTEMSRQLLNTLTIQPFVEWPSMRSVAMVMFHGKVDFSAYEDLLSRLLAQGQTQIIGYLVSAGADPTRNDNEVIVEVAKRRIYFCDIFRTLVRNGADVNAREGQPLMNAIETDSNIAVECLLSLGANPSMQNYRAVMLAAKKEFKAPYDNHRFYTASLMESMPSQIKCKLMNVAHHHKNQGLIDLLRNTYGVSENCALQRGLSN
jgi:hypothetical protein